MSHRIVSTAFTREFKQSGALHDHHYAAELGEADAIGGDAHFSRSRTIATNANSLSEGRLQKAK